MGTLAANILLVVIVIAMMDRRLAVCLCAFAALGYVGTGAFGQGPGDPSGLLTAIASHQWLLVSAILIGGAVRLVKGDTPLPMVPPRYRPWLAVGLGAVSAVLQSLVQHVPIGQALVQGALSVFVAISGHELLVESLLGGKEPLSSTSTKDSPP